MNSTSIFLPGNVASSKNSRELGFYYLKPEDESSWFIKKDGNYRKIRPTLQSSKLTKEYVKHIAPFIIENRIKFKKLLEGLTKPYIVELHFVRDSKRAFDFQNATQCISDSLTGHYWKNDKQIPYISTQWLNDDNMSEVLFIPPLQAPHYTVDTKKPGVWITVLRPEQIQKSVDLFSDSKSTIEGSGDVHWATMKEPLFNCCNSCLGTGWQKKVGEVPVLCANCEGTGKEREQLILKTKKV